MMTKGRIVLGATGEGKALHKLARRLRDDGHEVVLIGGNQSAEQLVRTALAEDASELVVSADPESMALIDVVRRELGADHIVLAPAGDV